MIRISLTKKTKSNAGYRSLAIIQGANTDIVRLCRKTKKEREDFSPQKKTSMRTPPEILTTLILYHTGGFHDVFSRD